MQAYAPAPVVAHPAPVAAMAPMASAAPVLDTAAAAFPANYAAPPPAMAGVPLRRRRPAYTVTGRRHSGRRTATLAAQGSLPPETLAGATLPAATEALTGYTAPPPLLTSRDSYTSYPGRLRRLTKFGSSFASMSARMYKFYTMALKSTLQPVVIVRGILGIGIGQDLARLESHLHPRRRSKQKRALAQFQAWIKYIVNQLASGVPPRRLGLPATIPITTYQPVRPISFA